MTHVLIPRPREEDPRGRMPRDNGDRDRSDASANQEEPRTTGSPLKLGEHRTDPTLRPLGGTTLADTLLLDFPSPELKDDGILWFSATPFMALCCGSPGKLISGDTTDVTWCPMAWELGGQRAQEESGGKVCLGLRFG